jgi:enolase
MPDSRIVKVVGRRVWDSRGRPTVEAEVHCADGTAGRAIAPSGASRGSREAIDLRDGGSAFGGLDVTRAVAGINGAIAKRLAGMDALDQDALDAALIALDGTPDKSRLGGNAMIAVSLASLQAAASSRGLTLWQHLAEGGPVSLPMPQIQIFGGGAHAGGRIDIQDLMVVPVGAASFVEACSMVAEVYRAAGNLMSRKGSRAGVADEGGWWPDFARNDEALATLVRAIEAAGFHPGDDIAIALDVAASEFSELGDGTAHRYRFALEGREFDTDGLVELLLGWLDRYPIASIEDPLAEDDAAGMQAFTAAAGKRVQIVGDDYLVTSADLVRQAAASRACNAVLIKPNQAGTVMETRAALDAGKQTGFGTVVSARSGETEDVAIVHLAVGWNAGQLKVGSFARSERMAKWNEALRIEEALGGAAHFAGRGALDRGR